MTETTTWPQITRQLQPLKASVGGQLVDVMCQPTDAEHLYVHPLVTFDEAGRVQYRNGWVLMHGPSGFKLSSWPLDEGPEFWAGVAARLAHLDWSGDAGTVTTETHRGAAKEAIHTELNELAAVALADGDGW